MPESSSSSQISTSVLNAVIGFLSLLLFLLLIGLFTRFIYPRIETQRSENQPQLIGDVIQVEVLNGAGVSGLAGNFTSTLRSNGFDVVQTGNFDNFDMEETVVISRDFDTSSAEKVARALGVSEENILVEASDDFYLDATIVIGADFNTLN